MCCKSFHLNAHYRPICFFPFLISSPPSQKQQKSERTLLKPSPLAAAFCTTDSIVHAPAHLCSAIPRSPPSPPPILLFPLVGCVFSIPFAPPLVAHFLHSLHPSVCSRACSQVLSERRRIITITIIILVIIAPYAPLIYPPHRLPRCKRRRKAKGSTCTHVCCGATKQTFVVSSHPITLHLTT